MVKVALVKYRTKKYGKWFPKDRKDFKEVELSGAPSLTPSEDVKRALALEGITASEVMIERTEKR